MDSGELLESLMGGSAPKYIGYRVCVRRASMAERQEKMHIELGDLARQKGLAGVQDRNCPNRATRNRAWISTVPHCLNGTELSREELWDNICLRYGLMPQDIPATCDGCGKRFSI